MNGESDAREVNKKRGYEQDGNGMDGVAADKKNMSYNSTELRPGMISLIKIFGLIIFLELITLWFMLFAGFEVKIYYAAILLVPVIVLILPLVPAIGFAAMVATTALDYFGVITQDTSGVYTTKLTYFHIVMAVTLVSAFFNMIIRKKNTIPRLSIWAPLIAFLLMYTVSITRTHPRMINDAFITLVRVTALSSIVLALVLSLNRKWKLGIVVGAMIIMPLVVAVVTLYQLLFQGTLFAPIIIKMATALGLPVFRATGTFTNPNSMACFIMTGAVLGFALMFHKNFSFLLKVLIFLSIIVINLGLLGSFSRGGWVSAIAALSIIIVFHKKWSYLWYFGIILVVCLFIVSLKMPRLWEVVFERFGTIFNSVEDASSMGRIALIKTSIGMWMDYPIFGVGLRSFPAYFADYVDPSMPKVLSSYLSEAHTIQFEILAEFGIVGITITSWLFFTVLFEGCRTIRTMRNNLLRCLQIGLTALLVGDIVNFTFATDITNNMFWMTVGLIYVVPLIDREEKAPSRWVRKQERSVYC